MPNDKFTTMPGTQIGRTRVRTGLSKKQAREFNRGVDIGEIPERVRIPSARETRMNKTNGFK